MVQRGFWGVNNLSTSQALSKLVDVDQGVFLATVFGFDLEFKERPLISCDSRCLGFALLTIGSYLLLTLFPIPNLAKHPGGKLSERTSLYLIYLLGDFLKVWSGRPGSKRRNFAPENVARMASAGK